MSESNDSLITTISTASQCCSHIFINIHMVLDPKLHLALPHGFEADASVKKDRFLWRSTVRSSPLNAQVWITQLLHCKHTIPAFTSYAFTRRRHQCLVIAAIQLTTHLSTPKRMKGWAGLVRWPTADSLPIWMVNSCRSGAGQGKFVSQRPTFYHWATPLTESGSSSEMTDSQSVSLTDWPGPSY